jgi:hypothetical protein
MSSSNDGPTVQEQFDIIDTWRNPKLTNVKLVRDEMNFILDIKETNYSNLIHEYIESFEIFYKNCPDIFKYIITLHTDISKEFIQDSDLKPDPNYFKDKNIAKKNVLELFDKYKSLGGTFTDTNIDKWIQGLFLLRIKKENELIEFCKKEFTYVGEKFHSLLSTCIKYEYARHDEFRNILNDMLDKIKNVQDGKLSQKNCSAQVLQDDLGKRFHKKG